MKTSSASAFAVPRETTLKIVSSEAPPVRPRRGVTPKRASEIASSRVLLPDPVGPITRKREVPWKSFSKSTVCAS
ncbi:MAG: hypothetical protein L6R30_10180 [Thermoanaerobaculia bacterium]|nr:hypothetical protein [Thermoanaerobaculia bacterium]